MADQGHCSVCRRTVALEAGLCTDHTDGRHPERCPGSGLRPNGLDVDPGRYPGLE